MKKERVMRGKVVKLGDYVNTNVMSPGQWSREGLEVLRLHTMEAIRKDFETSLKELGREPIQADAMVPLGESVIGVFREYRSQKSS